MYEQLGRYRLLKLLATGGMGEVFLARQEGPRRLRQDGGGQAHLAAPRAGPGLRRHCSSTRRGWPAQLQHPNIAQVFGLEHEGNSWFIAMEYVHGRSLRDAASTRRGSRGLRDAAHRRRGWPSQALQGLHSPTADGRAGASRWASFTAT